MLASEFFNADYEKKINEKMMYYDYIFPESEVLEYINDICNITIGEMMEYIFSHSNNEITSRDIFQFSNFQDATFNVCLLLKNAENPGLKHLEIGKLLLNDGKVRNDGAYVKYGENHAKTATSIGLLYELCSTYFLSCIGMIYPDLDFNLSEKLLTRLIIRNRLISRILKASKNGDLNMRQFLYMISDSTFIRRSSNIKSVLNILVKSSEYDFNVSYEKLIFTFEKF